MQGESLSAAIMEVEPFKKTFQEVLEERGLSREQIFNADESGLYWKLMPSKTLVTPREKEAKAFKQPKDRVTIMACANASGSIKLLLVFIHKYAYPRCFKNIAKRPSCAVFQSKKCLDGQFYLQQLVP